jgi:hypothetical protein
VIRTLVDLLAALSAAGDAPDHDASRRDRQMKLLALALIVVTGRLRREHQL